MHAQTLRYYERVGLIWPSRTGGRQRLYSMADLERIRRVKALTEEMGVNLAGAEIALKLMARVQDLEQENQRLSNDLNRLKAQQNAPAGRSRSNV